jgi:hypothetical protein
MQKAKSVKSVAATVNPAPVGQDMLDILRRSPGPGEVTITVDLTLPWDVWQQLSIISKADGVTIENLAGQLIQNPELCDAWNEVRDKAEVA